MAKVQFKIRSVTKTLIVHCAATKPSMNWGAREIRQLHKEQNGWLDIGYHYVIKRDGTVESGREVNQVGAHTVGQNETSVGICLVGGVNDRMQPEANFTPQQMHALRILLDILKEQYPGVTIKGHRDFAPKACPSFDVKRWLDTNELVTAK